MDRIIRLILSAKSDEELNGIITNHNGILEMCANGFITYEERNNLIDLIYTITHHDHLDI